VTGARIFAVDAVAFDLDGTLLDTVHDLAKAVNLLLADLGLEPLPTATVRDLVGKGMANLVRNAMLRAATTRTPRSPIRRRSSSPRSASASP